MSDKMLRDGWNSQSERQLKEHPRFRGTSLVSFSALLGTSWEKKKKATSVLFALEAVTCLSCFIRPKLNEGSVIAC